MHELKSSVILCDNLTVLFKVNLIPDARPQDVYSEVAALVEKRRNEDASDGMHIAQQLQGNTVPLKCFLNNV